MLVYCRLDACFASFGTSFHADVPGTTLQSSSRDDASLLRVALCSIASLQSFTLAYGALGSAELAELASSLYSNTSIKELDLSGNNFNDISCARLLRGIIYRNKTMTTLNFSRNEFGQTASAVECIVDGLGSNSTLLNIDLSDCALGDGGVSTLAQSLGSRNTRTKNLKLATNAITSTGVSTRVLVCSSKRWSRAATTSRISPRAATALEIREPVA
jgi:hypothetical protein